MTTCPKCPAHGAAPTPKGWLFELCPDHMLQALVEVRDTLANSVSSLERATNRIGHSASDRAA